MEPHTALPPLFTVLLFVVAFVFLVVIPEGDLLLLLPSSKTVTQSDEQTQRGT
jgi:hypothetical protein